MEKTTRRKASAAVPAPATKRQPKLCELADIPAAQTKTIGSLGVCYRVQDVATVFGSSVQTIYAMVNTGRLSGTKLGKATWIPLSSIEAAFGSPAAPGGE